MKITARRRKPFLKRIFFRKNTKHVKRFSYSRKLRTNLFIFTQFSAPTEEEESKTTAKSMTANGGQGTEIYRGNICLHL